MQALVWSPLLLLLLPVLLVVPVPVLPPVRAWPR
jgi:hypothetical protein